MPTLCVLSNVYFDLYVNFFINYKKNITQLGCHVAYLRMFRAQFAHNSKFRGV